MLDNPQKSNITMHKGLWQNDCTFCHSPFFVCNSPVKKSLPEGRDSGASEGTRTLMHGAQDPKSCASTNSATLA